MEKNICLLIVTYNRKAYLEKLLKQIVNQTEKIDGIFIFDNYSSDGTDKLLRNMNIIKDIKEQKVIENRTNDITYYYYRNNRNTGGAGGFHKAFELIYDMNKFQYIWAMDDDVIPEDNCLEKLINFQDKDTMITIPNRTDENFQDKACVEIDLKNPFKIFMKKKKIIKGEKLREQESIEVVDMAFEGPLVNCELLEKIGLPDEKYFIQFDDTDYATRASKVTKLRFVRDAILHKQIIPTSINNKLMNWKDYYAYRNDILFCQKYAENIFVKYITPILLYINLFLKTIIKRKWKNIKVINKAFKDGYTKNEGKTINPGEL